MVEDKHPYIIENSVTGNTKVVVFHKNENDSSFFCVLGSEFLSKNAVRLAVFPIAAPIPTQ